MRSGGATREKEREKERESGASSLWSDDGVTASHESLWAGEVRRRVSVCRCEDLLWFCTFSVRLRKFAVILGLMWLRALLVAFFRLCVEQAL